MTNIVIPRIVPFISNRSVRSVPSTRPLIQYFSINGEVQSGQDIVFHVNASGPVTYQWQITTTAGGPTWTDIVGAVNSSYTYTGNIADDGKLIRVVVTNVLGSSYSDPVVLDVELGIPTYTWGAVGNNFPLTGTTSQDGCRIDTDTLAIINGTDGGIQAYQFDGSDWSTLGNFLALADTTVPKMCQLDTNLIAYYSESGFIRAYGFNGTNWSAVGNALDTGDGPAFAHAIAALSSTRISVWSLGILQAYDWDGTDFTPVGNSLNTYSVSQGNMHADGMSGSTIVTSEQQIDEISVFGFDGSDWSQLDSYPTASSTIIHCGALSPSKVVYSDVVDDSLQTLDWNVVTPNELTHLDNDLVIVGNPTWLRPFMVLSATRVVLAHSSTGLQVYDAVIT